MVVSGATEPVGSVDVALAHAARLLERDPALLHRFHSCDKSTTTDRGACMYAGDIVQRTAVTLLEMQESLECPGIEYEGVSPATDAFALRGCT